MSVLGRALGYINEENERNEIKAFIDTETTGLPRDDSHVVSIGVVFVQGCRVIQTYYTLIKPSPGTQWPDSSPYHDVTNDEAMRTGIYIDAALERIDELVRILDVRKMFAYNAQFDHFMLTRDAGSSDRALLDLLKVPWFCVLKMVRKQSIPGRKSLVNVCKHFKITQSSEIAQSSEISTSNFHNALYDAKMAWEVYRRLENQGDRESLKPRLQFAIPGTCGRETKKRTPCTLAIGCCHHH